MKKRFKLLCMLFLIGIGVSFAQTRVTGSVTDENGEPIIGASVMVKGTNVGISTDANGLFTLIVPGNASTLVFSYVGMNSLELPVRPQMDVLLRSNAELLEEVVVVGYGTQRKANLTGAVSTVDVSKTLEARPYSEISKALQGVVAGLTVISNSGKLGAQPTLTIRGIGTLSNSGTSKPFIVVDGVPMEDISLLNTQDIENISVLKDAASTSIYGTRAAFGVILITT